ncbi:MAG: cell division/cell wall cluster transcriptional repressor MraZ [Planctomycetes bacterium]|nr:cell division/cell wall cluster transcriptional repressor MraZ [Planctomycetota bacterium]
MAATVFTGRHDYTLDSKGRVAIPKPLLEQLRRISGAESPRLALTLGTEDCLFLVLAAELHTVLEEGRAEFFDEEEPEDFRRLFYSTALESTPDPQGRIVVSPDLRTYAGLESDVTFLGTGRRIEVWSTKRWNDRQRKLVADFTRMARAAKKASQSKPGGGA